MSKTVFLMRHAKSDWSQHGGSDHERPLNSRGQSAAPAMGRFLAETRRPIGLIISSTAVRAYSTATAVASELKLPVDQIVLDKNLYLAPPEAYLTALREVSQSEESVLLVGHNPGISDLAGSWSHTSIEMPTAAVVEIQLELEDWRALSSSTQSSLVDFKRPREL